MPSPDAAVQKRRAVGLIVLTVFLPGAAQFAAGNRRLGRVALRILALLVAAALLVGLGLLFWRGPTVSFLLNGPVTIVMRVLVWLVFLGWLVLLFERLAAGPAPEPAPSRPPGPDRVVPAAGAARRVGHQSARQRLHGSWACRRCVPGRR